jgi:hypothetical protein
MTHFVILIIIPRRIYLQGKSAIENYIKLTLTTYGEDYEVEPYIVHTYDELVEEYDKFKQSKDVNHYQNLEEYVSDYYGYKLDRDGNAVSTINKDAIYDYYTVGGRWDGILTGNIQQSCNGFNFDDKHHTIENNSIPVMDLIKKYHSSNEIYHTVFDRKGTLCKGENIGWFGSSTNVKEIDEWKKEYLQILEDAKNDYVVNLDAHI